MNFSNIPGGMISGADDDVLKWIEEVSNERYLEELSFTFEENLNALDNEDGLISEEVENKLNEIETEAIPRSTMKQMIYNTRKFKKFLSEKNLDQNFEKLPCLILNKYLRYFYSELKREDGTPYAPASLICIRASLQRKLSLPEFGRPAINIISGDQFAGSNRMLKAMVARYLKSDDKKKPEERYPPIEVDDMIKIRASFSRLTPTELQDEFVFNCLYYFGLRGRETLRHLERNSFEIKTDTSNRRYLYLIGDRLSKNCKASLTPKDFEDAKKVRAYECNERPSECPVICFELYMSKLPASTSSLFPKPLSKPTNEKWYCDTKQVGKNSLGELLPRLSTKLNLQKRYTNHCVRVTCVQVLREQGYNNESIALVTGHKDPKSVQRYAKKRRDDGFYYPSEALQAGSSASISRKVVPVGSGKVVIDEQSSRERNVDVECSSASIVFSGNFLNCNFQIK